MATLENRLRRWPGGLYILPRHVPQRCVCVCVCVCVCMCVCVCVSEREWGEGYQLLWWNIPLCVCVSMRVCVCVCVCPVYGGISHCVCVGVCACGGVCVLGVGVWWFSQSFFLCR